MFQAIIRDLKWPGGSLAFWPMAALAHHTDESVASRLVPNSELFWRGVQQVQARTVLCFGARALAAIHPQSAASGVPFGQVDLAQPARATDPSTGVFSLYGTTLFALPEPHEILRSGPEGPAAVSSALRMLVRL